LKKGDEIIARIHSINGKGSGENSNNSSRGIKMLAAPAKIQWKALAEREDVDRI
jgi:hypothetical protein